MGALAELKESTGAPVCIHELDERCLREGKYSLCDMAGMSPPGISADIILHDGDKLEIESTIFKVIHTPGHTEGSVCLYFNDGISHLIAGDTLFQGSYGRTDFPGGSKKTLISSITMLKQTLPGDTIVCPGHGRKTLLKYEDPFGIS